LENGHPLLITAKKHKFVTASLLKRLRAVTAASLLKPPCGGLGIETAIWIQKPEAEVVKKIRWGF
jgi:hypothetical protein